MVLVIFMILIPAVREGVFVKTPEAKYSQELSSEAEGDVVISLREDGSLYVNLKKISWNELKRELEIAYHGREAHPVIIKGAETLLYEDVLKIMEICRNVGAPGVELVAKKKR
ncbi:MAG: biopolymer transporter ExbD [Candidatus Latescibacteria bacterium]|nr:biopolymer transporter ExbD [Candidatus Latescibacterota bacterium]MCK5329554.1 biopolymer transporter ExbD [Candidatus Latescibacterota bacterium]